MKDKDYDAAVCFSKFPNLWKKKKPKFIEECLLLAASRVNENYPYDYSLFQIRKVTDDRKWYWGVFNEHGEEWGDIDDLYAQLYCVLPLLKE